MADKLPGDVLRTIYRSGHDHGGFFKLRDRVRALGVCKAWRQALSFNELPIPRLDIGLHQEQDVALCKWVVTTRPAVEQVLVWTPNNVAEGILPQVFQALQEALQELFVWQASTSLTALPNAELLPNLRKLTVLSLDCQSPWLQRLSRLHQLECLRLSFSYEAGHVQLALPSMPRLARLHLNVCSSGALHLQLEGLPKLTELAMHGSNSVSLESASGEPAAQLRQVVLCIERAAVQFALLPGLEQLTLKHTEFEGVSTLAAATCLTCLVLEKAEGSWDFNTRWVLGVLRAVPSSLRALALMGRWSCEVAAQLGSMSQLSALFLRPGHAVGNASMSPLPPDGAPVWASLRAFAWAPPDSSVPLPKALSGAAQLQALQVFIGRLEKSDR